MHANFEESVQALQLPWFVRNSPVVKIAVSKTSLFALCEFLDHINYFWIHLWCVLHDLFAKVLVCGRQLGFEIFTIYLHSSIKFCVTTTLKLVWKKNCCWFKLRLLNSMWMGRTRILKWKPFGAFFCTAVSLTWL